MWPKMLKMLNPVSYGASRMERPVVIDLAPVSFRSNINLQWVICLDSSR